MARIVIAEDSDEEFPDLKDLLEQTRAVTVKDGSSGLRLRKILKPDAEPSDIRAEEDEVPRTRTRRIGVTLERKEDAQVRKSRPKKRVLNQTTDNRLLRPLASSSLSRGSSKPLGSSNTRVDAPQWKGTKRSSANGASGNVSSVDPGRGDRLTKVKRLNHGKDPTKKAAKREREKGPPKKGIHLDSDDEEFEGGSGLSDFIVDDSTFLDETIVEVAPPRSARRLVQGRQHLADLEDSDSEDLERRMAELEVEDDVFQSWKRSVDRNLEDFAKDYGEEAAAPGFRESKKRSEVVKPGTPKSDKEFPRVKTEALSSDLDDLFTLSYSPSESKPRKVSTETRLVTPPRSPTLKTKKLQSPKKQFARIPLTPHRPSMDSFWQQDIVNDWNDEYSPQKILQPNPKSLLHQKTFLDGSPRKSPLKQDKAAREAKKVFSQSKHALAESFLVELDTTITNSEIGKLAASTGGVKIIWSKKLNTTAGRANWKRETITSSSTSLGEKPTHRHHATIELAEKVIDDEERLLNVIAHEFCHLANFMISNIKTNPHGKEFKAWAAKCSRHFRDRGIEVTTKHSYAIDYKYVWECVSCGIEFKRHSKSIDPARHQCGGCKNKLVQTKPVPRAGAGTAKVSEYQLFVKENMKRLREENPGSPQKEIMGLVGKEYRVFKASKVGVHGGKEKSLESVDNQEVLGSKEGTPDDDGDDADVVRKLDFLDLTSL